MEQNEVNEAALLSHVCKIMEKNRPAFVQAGEQNEQTLQIEGLAVDFGAKRVRIDEVNIDFEAGSVQAWEKNIYLTLNEYETLSDLADQLGVMAGHSGFLVRISGETLEIPILLYIAPLGVGKGEIS